MAPYSLQCTTCDPGPVKSSALYCIGSRVPFGTQTKTPCIWTQPSYTFLRHTLMWIYFAVSQPRSPLHPFSGSVSCISTIQAGLVRYRHILNGSGLYQDVAVKTGRGGGIKDIDMEAEHTRTHSHTYPERQPARARARQTGTSPASLLLPPLDNRGPVFQRPQVLGCNSL